MFKKSCSPRDSTQGLLGYNYIISYGSYLSKTCELYLSKLLPKNVSQFFMVLSENQDFGKKKLKKWTGDIEVVSTEEEHL